MVMAWSVDRLGRSLQDLVGFLSELHALKIDLFLRQQGLDTTTPAGKAMFQMLGVFAEFERAMIAERVRAGLARARSEGKRLGRPPIGLALEKRIREALAAPGRPGVRVIAKQFGVDPGTVQHQPPFRPRRRRRRLAVRGAKRGTCPLRVFVSIEVAEAGLTGFRTIQVYPRTCGALPGHAEPAVGWHSGFRGGAHARRKATPVHHAAWRCGGGSCLPAGGARAAGGDAGWWSRSSATVRQKLGDFKAEKLSRERLVSLRR
jgi:hypothetical protein